jgi:CheY-like chemotaxis protein
MERSAKFPLSETVLVVDDDKDICWIFEIALVGLGCNVTTVGSAQDAISLVTERAYLIAFIDARLPDMDGLRLIETLRDLQPTMRVIVVSGYYFEDDIRISEAIHAAQIDGFLAKPFRIDSIVAALTDTANGS